MTLGQAEIRMLRDGVEALRKGNLGNVSSFKVPANGPRKVSPKERREAHDGGGVEGVENV